MDRRASDRMLLVEAATASSREQRELLSLVFLSCAHFRTHSGAS